MEIEYKGGNCVSISFKKDTFVTDPKLSDVGLKDQGSGATAVLLTQNAFAVPPMEDTLVIDMPGEYEINNCSVRGVAARRHAGAPDAPPEATMFRLEMDGVSVAILGHIDPKLSDEQLEDLGMVDILIVPVGNHGYTLDAKSAVEVVRKIEPKVIIPTHYADDAVKYEVSQAPLADFVKELGVPLSEETSKVKLKSGMLPASLTVLHLLRTK